jgi:hypothetical protein
MMPQGNLRDLAFPDPETRAERAMVRRVLAGIELASALEELAAADRELDQLEAAADD